MNALNQITYLRNDAAINGIDEKQSIPDKVEQLNRDDHIDNRATTMTLWPIPLEINELDDIQVKFYKAGDVIPQSLHHNLDFKSDWHVAV